MQRVPPIAGCPLHAFMQRVRRAMGAGPVRWLVLSLSDRGQNWKPLSASWSDVRLNGGGGLVQHSSRGPREVRIRVVIEGVDAELDQARRQEIQELLQWFR